jgi:hypothetical protein
MWGAAHIRVFSDKEAVMTAAAVSRFSTYEEVEFAVDLWLRENRVRTLLTGTTANGQFFARANDENQNADVAFSFFSTNDAKAKLLEKVNQR